MPALYALPRNHLRACLALLVAEGPAHGYELLDRLAALGLAGADCGAVYKTLRSMEADDHVASAWAPSSSGPARRTYRITGPGRAWLGRSAAAVAVQRDAVGAYLDRHLHLVAGRRCA